MSPFLQILSIFPNMSTSILPSSVSIIDESQRMRDINEAKKRFIAIDKDNSDTRATYHSDGQGIQLVLKNGTSLDLRVGTVVQCDVIRGGTCFLKVTGVSSPGREYPSHPIGFFYSEWIPENGWLMGTHPIGLYPGSTSHCVTHGYDFNTMRLCPNPDGSPVPTYVAPPETPEELGRQLLAAFSAKWFTDLPAILAKGASLTYADTNGDTILHYACRFKKTETAQQLVRLGANVSIPNKRGVTPLHDACRTNNPHLVRNILREGCPVDVRTDTGETPLMRACLETNLHVVRALLNDGASVNATNDTGETPLMFACYDSHRDLKDVTNLLKVLLEAGALVDVEVPATPSSFYRPFRTPRELCKDRDSLLTLLNTPVEAPAERLPLAQERIEEARQKIASGNKWTELNLRNLGLTVLPPIPEGIWSLNVEDNRLTTISTLPTSLTTLNCSKNRLVSLPPILPPALFHFDCSQNRLSALPPLPPRLVFLDCGGNRIESLPPMEHLLQLVEVYCGGNRLTELPPMPSTQLQRIWCSSNRLTSLPPLKHLTALKQLRCGENRLREIPEVPETFHLLNCGDNLLKALPPLPRNMVELLTDGNLAYLGYINKD